MADRRYTDKNNEDKRRLNIEDDYLELLSDYDDDEFEDVFSDSSKDIYIGQAKNKQNDSSDDIYISKRKNNNYEDVFSQSDRQYTPQPQRRQVTPKAEQPQPRRTPQVPLRQVNDKYTTQKVRKVTPVDSDEISDYEARHGKSASNSGK